MKGHPTGKAVPVAFRISGAHPAMVSIFPQPSLSGTLLWSSAMAQPSITDSPPKEEVLLQMCPNVENMDSRTED